MLQEAAVFAAPHIIGKDGNRDGLPTVLLESIALGTPCVATDVTGIPELIHEQKTGLLVPQNDPKQLALALQRMLQDADLRVNCASAARKLLESNFDIRINTASLRQIFS